MAQGRVEPRRRIQDPQTARPTPFNGKRNPPQPEHAPFTLKIQKPETLMTSS